MPQGKVEDLAQAGWGLDGGLLAHVCLHSPFLATLKVGLGASVGDSELRALAAACPHLRRLELNFAAVSDAGTLLLCCQQAGRACSSACLTLYFTKVFKSAMSMLLGCGGSRAPGSRVLGTEKQRAGVSAVLRGCASVVALRLLRCAGPLGDALGEALTARPRLERLAELCLVGGAERLSDAGMALLASPCARSASVGSDRGGPAPASAVNERYVHVFSTYAQRDEP